MLPDIFLKFGITVTKGSTFTLMLSDKKIIFGLSVSERCTFILMLSDIYNIWPTCL